MSANEPKSFFERANDWIKNSITIKLLSVGIIILLLLIPSAWVTDLIRERQQTSWEAVEEVGSKWGGVQTISGPVISVPYKVYARNDKDQVIVNTQYSHFLPEDLKIGGKVNTEKRKRGIYEIIAYNGKLHLDGKFKRPSPAELNIQESDVLWNEAFVQLGVSDMKGINSKLMLKMNDAVYQFNPGIETNDVVESGVSVKVNLQDSVNEYSFAVDLDLNGSGELYFTPMGKETNVKIESSWSSPSFTGSFLPDVRNVTSQGFDATWNVLHLNRNYPQQWKSGRQDIYESRFGINFLITVDHYQRSMRAAKYAVLIMALTFMGFFFVEIINKIRIHPFQYILIGLAISIFYALVLAFSEHIGFDPAYLISGVLVIGAISYYAKSIFNDIRHLAVLTSVLVAIYTFIYVIIRLEDYALLVGSSGLFLVLLIIMHISRKIKWYND